MAFNIQQYFISPVGIASIIGFFLFLWITWKLVGKAREHGRISGSHAGRAEAKKKGKKDKEKAGKRILDRIKKWRKKRRKIKQQQKATEGDIKQLPRGPERKALMAGEQAAEGATMSVQLVEDKDISIGASTQRRLETTAGAQEITDASYEVLALETTADKNEEAEEAAINRLLLRINNTSNEERVDATMTNYLRRLYDTLKQQISALVTTEEGKDKTFQDQVNRTDDAIHEIKTSTAQAKRNLTALRGQERKEVKNFEAEFKKIKAAIRAKEAELKRIKRKSKGADPRVVKLEEELKLKRRQYRRAVVLHGRIKQLFAYFKKALFRLRKLMGKIIKTEKFLKSAEAKIKATLAKLKQTQKKLDDSAREVSDLDLGKITNIHELAIMISKVFNRFYTVLQSKVERNIAFNRVSNQILARNEALLIQLEAYAKIQDFLERLELSVNRGMTLVTRIIMTIVGDKDSAEGLQELEKMLKEEGSLEYYQAQLNQQELNYAKQVEDRTKAVIEMGNNLIDHDEEFLKTIVSHKDEKSRQLGQVTGSVVRRKQNINARYMPNVKAYSDSLGRINPAMHTAFNQAYNLQQTAQQQARRVA